MDYNLFIILSLILFTSIQIFIIVKYFSQKKYPLIGENFVILLVCGLFIYLQYRYNFLIERKLFAFFFITILGHTFIGEFLDIYNKYKPFDRYLHVFGGFTFGLFSYSLIAKTITPIVEPRLYVTLFIIALGLAISALFEIAEFIIDSIFNSQSQSGLKDTNVDLICGLIGAIIAGITYTSFISF